jgi:plastocyanin
MILQGNIMTFNTSTSGGLADDGVRSVTRFAIQLRLFASRFTLGCMLAAAAAMSCPAGELDVSVVDRQGRGVGEVVVMVAPVDKHPAKAAPAPAVMDQRNLAFLPRVLVVAVGTEVEFPNNDTVSHQVYSFSAAKKFHLPLYKGELHSPVLFDHEGLVVLGCNIHDSMAGYIYVTDAPFFGKTDTAGMLRLPSVPVGDYRIAVWSPFIADPDGSRTVHVDGQAITSDQVQLVRELRTRPEPRPQRGDWEY